MKIANGMMLFITLGLFLGCETGTSTEVAPDKLKAGGIVSQKSTKVSSSDIKTIYSNSGQPGYYIQMGHFQEKKSGESFLNRIKSSHLPSTLLTKYDGNTANYYALVGPYRSYNQAAERKRSVKYISSSAFVVNVTRP